jgi:hypothetical protein
MQRIGRVDRRRSKTIEDALLSDHPDISIDRGNVYYWNFLPPIELEQLLSLYSIVSKKALRISKTFGIEGKQLLTPEDDYEALRDFNSAYEGAETKDEEMALEYQKLIIQNPNYLEQVKMLPQKMFSGRLARTIKGIFFCYELPAKRADGTWTSGDGFYKWYLFDSNSNEIIEHTHEIWQEVRSTPEDQRKVEITVEDFAQTRKIVEAYLNKVYLRSIQAPIGIKPRLVTWMQLN